jgi:hypothetical protein
MIDEIRFLQRHLPGLSAGEYEIAIEQEVKSSKIQPPQPPYAAKRKFSVRCERFALRPSDVQAVFPPAGSLGDHANVLPHIVLSRGTLPWERRGDSGDANTPWLALLVFHEGEAPAILTLYVITEQTLAALKAEAVPDDVLSILAGVKEREFAGEEQFFTALKDAIGDEQAAKNRKAIVAHADKRNVIEVNRSWLESVLPGKSELEFLTHVRESADYVITDRALAGLKAEGLFADILSQLAGLKEQTFIGTEAFLDALKTAIGEQQAAQHVEEIARHAADRIELAVVIGNRLPKSGGASTAHLVSVEGCYNASGFNFPVAAENGLIRLTSLHNWSFACVDPLQSFTGLLTQLDRKPGALHLLDGKPGQDAAKESLKQGALPLWHALRQGGRTVSWYHGPLAPGEIKLGDSSAPDLPARAADELLRYNRATGMFDVSYAAAWELGRLLALQSKTFSVSLYNWKRAHVQQLRQAEDQLLHASPLEVESKPESVPLPKEVAGWFKSLSLLKGVPFNYLVPDERLLPVESIRFFQLDWLWIECLLDGAFSIGRVMEADRRRDAAHAQSPAANPHANVSGLLMRSEVVAGWPGLLVDGFHNQQKLPLLRMDRLSANVMLCLFEGAITAVDLHLRPEMVHFGLDWEEGSFYKKLRDSKGDAGGGKLEPKDILWRPAPPGTLNVSELFKKIKGEASPFTSAQFALQMIETSERVRFHL